MSTTGTVNAPQYNRRGVSALQEARTRRENEQKEIAKQKSSDEMLRQTLIVARRERIARIENATQMIAKLLRDGEFREAQEKTLSEIHWMLGELKIHADPQDRFWIAKKVLHFTSWRGMKALNDVEEVLTSVFGENIPDEIAENLARLIDKQTKFLRDKAKRDDVMRPGKTDKDHGSGSWKQHLVNVALRAAENHERVHGGNNGGGKGNKQKKKK